MGSWNIFPFFHVDGWPWVSAEINSAGPQPIFRSFSCIIRAETLNKEKDHQLGNYLLGVEGKLPLFLSLRDIHDLGLAYSKHVIFVLEQIHKARELQYIKELEVGKSQPSHSQLKTFQEIVRYPLTYYKMVLNRV